MSQVCDYKKDWKCISYSGKILKVVSIFIVSIISTSFYTYAQNQSSSKTVQVLNLDQCIVYALQNQPAVKQSLLSVSIAKKTNAINLSAWIPQVNLSGSFHIMIPCQLFFR